jgi:hypothetical protein
LIGTWKIGERRQRFREDGVFVSIEVGGWICKGQYWFEGNLLHIKDISENCSTREVGIYEVQGIPQDYLIIKPVSDYSMSRSAHFIGTWEWHASP